MPHITIKVVRVSIYEKLSIIHIYCIIKIKYTQGRQLITIRYEKLIEIF